MLQFLRGSSQSWAMRLFFAVLVVAFVVLWGVGDVFRGSFGGQKFIARVGSTEISAGQFAHALQREIARLHSQNITSIDKDQIKQVVLQNLLMETLLDIEVERLGLVISDAQIRNFIREEPSFKDERGQFDKGRYQGILRMLHMSEKEYVAFLKKSLQRDQLIKSIVVGIQAPYALVAPFYEWQQEKRHVDVAFIKLPLAQVPLPSSEQVQAYYTQHQDFFKTPEIRDFSVLILNEADLREAVQLSEEEITQGFEEYRETNEGGSLPTRREQEQILKTLKQEKAMRHLQEIITQVEDALGGGATLAEINKNPTFKDTKLFSFQGLTREQKNVLAQKIAAFEKNLSVEDVLQEAFTKQVDDNIDLIEVEEGLYFAVQVLKIVPTQEQPLEAVRSQVTQAWQREEQLKQAQQLAEKIVKSVNERPAQGTLAQQAHAHKLTLTQGIALERTTAPSDSAIPPALVPQVFNLMLYQAVMLPASGGYVIAQVNQVISEKAPSSLNDQKLKKFQEQVHFDLVQDVYNQLLVALEKKYKVEINHRLFEQI